MLIEPAPDHDPEITRLYNEGKERREIASEMGLEASYISRRLTKLRKWGRLTRESERNQAKLLYSEIRVYLYRGMSEKQMLDMTGLSRDELRASISAIKKDEHKFNRSKCRRAA